MRILTNVPAAQLGAQEIARLSCRQWSAQLPVPLEPVFNSEMLALGQPRAALLTFGIDRILFSVDWPFVKNTTATEWVKTVPLCREDKVKLLSGNAKRLLKM